MTESPDLRFLLLPLPEFALLPFGGFLDKLRFSADDEDYSRQRYCAWTILGLQPGHVLSSSGAALRITGQPLRAHPIPFLSSPLARCPPLPFAQAA